MMGISYFYYLLTFTSALTSLNSFSFCHGGRHYSLCQSHLPSCVPCSLLKAIWGHSRTAAPCSLHLFLILRCISLYWETYFLHSESFPLEKSLRRVLVNKFVFFYTLLHTFITFSSVQSLSCVQLFATPWTEACQASLPITNSQSLLKLMSIVSVMPSNHLILCCPLLLLPSIFHSIRVFSNESVLHIRWPKYWRFSFSISPSNE